MRFHQSDARGTFPAYSQWPVGVHVIPLSSYTYEWKMGAEQTFLLNVLCSDKCQFSFIGK